MKKDKINKVKYSTCSDSVNIKNIINKFSNINFWVIFNLSKLKYLLIKLILCNFFFFYTKIENLKSEISTISK
jgi:hypothetical protein